MPAANAAPTPALLAAPVADAPKSAARPDVAKADTTMAMSMPMNGSATRRTRGIMIQSTLWKLDHKRKATRERMYGPSTRASTLMPR